MRLAMRLPPKKGDGTTGAGDPREQESAEVIDLASRSAFPGVADRKAKTDGLGLAAGGLIVLALGATTFWAMNAPEAPAPEPIGNPDVAPPQQAAAPAPAETPAEAPAPAPARPDPAPAPVLARDPGADAARAANPYASPTMVYDASTAADAARVAEPAGASPSGEVMGNAGDVGPGGSAAAFASRIGGVGGTPAQARAMVNPTTTVTQGTMIPAVLETAINTDVPGYVRAVVSQDVKSFDGKKVLIPRSSRLVGQYQSGVEQGQKRAYVVWTRLIRPDGASINIASPAVAFNGTTGLEGDVDTHFWSRFGSGLLFSTIGGLGAIATGGVGGVIVAGGSQSAANSAVQQSGQRPPTIRVRAGEPIRVFTARDLDFSTVTN